jgi:hypothetical protein
MFPSMSARKPSPIGPAVPPDSATPGSGAATGPPRTPEQALAADLLEQECSGPGLLVLADRKFPSRGFPPDQADLALAAFLLKILAPGTFARDRPDRQQPPQDQEGRRLPRTQARRPQRHQRHPENTVPPAQPMADHLTQGHCPQGAAPRGADPRGSQLALLAFAVLHGNPRGVS